MTIHGYPPRRARGTAILLALLLHAATTIPTLAAQPADVDDSAFIAANYVRREARIAMRDGARLFTVLYVPRDASPARRYPVVLQRTPFSVGPYGPDSRPRALGPDPFMMRDGYVFASQEVRGRYLSEGEFENVRPLLDDSVKARDPRATDEATDAWDTIEWIARNVPEADGRVGLLGISYGGYYAAAASLSRHPAIVASSLQAPVMDFFFEDFHHNGALLQAHLSAFPIFGTPRPAPTASHWWLPAYQRALAGPASGDSALLALGPLASVTARVYPGDLWWRQVAAHPDYDAFWRARAMPPRLRGVRHPVLVVGGWFDAENLYGTLAAYRALCAASPDAGVSLVMGPWAHRGWGERGVARSTYGGVHFGDSLETAFQRDVEAAFFRAHLKGRERDAPTGARVFDTGRKRWVSLPGWPAPGAAPRTLFLHADGSLDASPPAGGAEWVEYESDPLRPVPVRCAGPAVEDGALYPYMVDDQGCFAGRGDVAVFQSAPLAEELTLGGEVVARLWVSTTGTDADFVVKLVDVPPDGEPGAPQRLVRGEIMRGRYRRSFGAPEPFAPGQVAEVTVRLPDVLHTFRRGHRVMVQVQGSWFPLFDRNPQRWVPSIPQAAESDFARATHRVWAAPGAASRLEVSVLR